MFNQESMAPGGREHLLLAFQRSGSGGRGGTKWMVMVSYWKKNESALILAQKQLFFRDN